MTDGLTRCLFGETEMTPPEPDIVRSPVSFFSSIKIKFNIIIIYYIMADTTDILAAITGWIYFFAWSISFYPQIFLNYKRKRLVIPTLYLEI